MKLVKLDKSNIGDIINKKIYCFKQSTDYMMEIRESFPELMDSIEGIIDDNKKKWGNFIFDKYSWNVEDIDIMRNINWEESTILITDGYFGEIFNKIQNMEIDRLNIVYYYVNKDTQMEEVYREKYKNEPLKNIIVFRSGPQSKSYIRGMDFSDNARALFEYMLDNGFQEKYELAWIVKNPDMYRNNSRYLNVTFVSWDSPLLGNEKEKDEYYRVLCQAKYLFFTDAYGFARNCREDQIRVQLWHGCGFKTRVNFERCEERYEYTTVISDMYAKIHAEIYGLRNDQVLVTGYAKEDWLFHPVDESYLSKLGIKEADKYIFWLPTFRIAQDSLSFLNMYHKNTEVGLPVIEKYYQLQELNELLANYGVVLIIKLHPFQKRSKIHCEGLDNIILIDNKQLSELDIHINQLLGYADAIISDYSSVAVDYLMLDRPIAFTLDDCDEYNNGRGFIFDNIKDWLPGEEIYNFEDYKKYIEDVSIGVDVSRKKRKTIKKHMHKYSDDKSCERIVETLGIK